MVGTQVVPRAIGEPRGSGGVILSGSPEVARATFRLELVA
jgi:hypothetical protein